jgi:hypothetical protein
MDEIWVPLVGMIVLWLITFMITNLVKKVKGRFMRPYSGPDRRENFSRGENNTHTT